MCDSALSILFGEVKRWHDLPQRMLLFSVDTPSAFSVCVRGACAGCVRVRGEL